MATLWVFGDSFAQTAIGQPNQLGWPKILAEKLNCDLQLFGLGGTSLFYSYMNFKNHNEKISSEDFVVFAITTPSRLYTGQHATKNINEVDILKGKKLTIASSDHSKYYLKQNLDNELTTQFLKAAEQYYQFLFEENFHNEIHRLLIKELIHSTIDKKIVFSELLPNLVHRKFTQLRLYDLVKYQWSLIFPNIKKRNAFGEINLLNHLTENNNLILANYFYDYLTAGKSDLVLTDFEQIDPADKEKYYKI